MTVTAIGGPRKEGEVIAKGEYTAKQPKSFHGYECCTPGCHHAVEKEGDECTLCMRD